MPAKKDYTGELFGTRLVIANSCTDEDWIKVGLTPVIGDERNRYKLTKCLSCGRIFPSNIKQIQRSNPKRCAFCSNIGNKYSINKTNIWVTYSEVALLKILNNNEIFIVSIDLSDYNEFSKYIWRVTKKRNKYYVLTGSPAKNNVIYMHQLIFKGQEIPEGYEIDHIDGNSLNNKRANLRIITRSENARNVKVKCTNKLGIRGVSYDSINGFYKCDFSYNNIRFYFTDFKTVEEAVYCRKFAEEYFGLDILNKNPVAIEYLNKLDPITINQIHEYVNFTIQAKLNGLIQ